MKILKTLMLAMVCGTLAGLGGCMDITGRGAAPLAKTIGDEGAQHPRVGHVYCMRGWLGIFSTGMDALAEKIDTQVGAPAVSVADEEWRRLKGWIIEEHQKGAINSEPLVLVGHSYGSDDMIRVAEELKTKGISVDLMVLLDPVTPPLVPSNVKRVYCVYMSHPLTDWYPAWRGVSASVVDPTATVLTNINLRTDNVGFDVSDIGHANIEKNDSVHKMVMEQVKLACPLRAAWTKMQAGKTTVSQATTPPLTKPNAATLMTP